MKALYRIASVLLLFFALGHTLGFRQNNPEWAAGSVIDAMRSLHFDAQGFNRSYWDFFSAFGLFFHRVTSVRRGIGVAIEQPSRRNFRPRASRGVGACDLLCRGHSSELQIRLHHPHRFLSSDHNLPDCRRLASSQESKLTGSKTVRCSLAILWIQPADWVVGASTPNARLSRKGTAPTCPPNPSAT